MFNISFGLASTKFVHNALGKAKLCSKCVPLWQESLKTN